MSSLRYPGIRATANGNQLVSYYTETRLAEAGVFYPITPSTEGGELFQQAYAEGHNNVFGRNTLAIEAEGEHAAQGGAIAHAATGKRVVNFTSGQGLVYALEQDFHAPGKGSTMVLEVGARALTKQALNVHCGHDDIYAALDTGWIMLFAKDAQQAADQALILRRTTELALTPGMNIMDGFLTTHLERTFYKHEAGLIREYLGAPEDEIDSPTEAQRRLFGARRRRVPKMLDLANPMLLGPVQNQEHYMQGVVARRNNFAEPILGFLEESYAQFAALTGRRYGLLSAYRTEDAETVFVSLGSAAENIEAAVDYLRARRGAKVGSIHLNVIRPFPEAAVVEALRGKKQVIVLERTDEALASDNPMAREIRTALSKALEGAAGLPPISFREKPTIFSGSYGLGSRDFRPEHILGAYEYAAENGVRTDGRRAAEGVYFFVLGVEHPYAVVSVERPSLLPEGAVAVRFHSIGGWGAITTGKNLGAILGDLNDLLYARDHALDERGLPKEHIHVSANPKYGSEKKGAPTSYFLVAAKERVRVNCDLRHVNVVLCCDPKAFTHCNPLDGMAEGGALVWESEADGEEAWRRLPIWARQQILAKKIRVFTLPGFAIARKATNRADLQMRMQGNAFLGAFFAVSPLLGEFGIAQEQFREVVLNQYRKKFGKQGEAVVLSNMEVMMQGFEQVREIAVGELAAADRSSLRGEALFPILAQVEAEGACGSCRAYAMPAEQPARMPLANVAAFDAEYRAGLGYDQPSTALSALGVVAAATGDTNSKYVARREVPLYIPENCTQCMECISVCPDTALPNTAQELGTVLGTAITFYVSDAAQREAFLAALPAIEQQTRARMVAEAKSGSPLPSILRAVVEAREDLSAQTKAEFHAILEKVPLAYQKVVQVFSSPERKEPGTGGVFSIFVSDLCKGCGACVVACGDHQALRMAPETETINAAHETGTAFLRLLPDTPAKYMGLYNGASPAESKTATLRNLLMTRSNYEALVSGDGACAGCGEKSVLRSVAAVTEAYMRPLYHAKSERLLGKAGALERQGAALLSALQARGSEPYALARQAIAHLILGLGGEEDSDTQARIAAYEAEHGALSDARLVEALAAVLLTEAFNHKELQAVDGRLANGMSVMAMAAHTGCNTVYGSTSPNNPHPYPWMNSLFQDGATVAWLMGESFIVDHARRSVIPERLADLLLDGERAFTPELYYQFTHFSDALMTDLEIQELPKVWAVGGDGGMGDIGYQNVSKVILQNRPNVKLLMLDTQVYSNTGGQNSDSSPMTGGFDMNTFGEFTQGKTTEKKAVAESFLGGHGSPFVAQVSMANAPRLYRAILDGLEYRGTFFLQAYTTCQPEHGVADDMALAQAQRARDSRGMPEFVYDPRLGESYAEALDIKGNPSAELDWYERKDKATGEMRRYTVAHWATSEARFRNHLRRISAEEAGRLIPLENMLVRLTQQDVVYRRFLDPAHRSYIPDFGVAILVEEGEKSLNYALSRQMVLYCVERRKAWRMLQSLAGVRNREYEAQRALLAEVDGGRLPLTEFLAQATALLRERIDGVAAKAGA